MQIISKTNDNAQVVAVCSPTEHATAQSGRIRIYDGATQVSETKLKPEVIAGSITALSYMKLNQALVIGSSDGVIKLIC